MIWTPDGRRRALGNALDGFEALVDELRRRGRLTGEEPPPSLADRAHRGLQQVGVVAWTYVALAVLVGVVIGAAVLLVGQGVAPTGVREVDIGLVVGLVLAGWLALSYAMDVALGDDLLAHPPAWATTGATLVVGVGLCVGAAFHDELCAVMAALGLAIVAYAIGARVRASRDP